MSWRKVRTLLQNLFPSVKPRWRRYSNIKGFLEIDLSLLFVLVEETPKEKGKRKKQKSPELEEGTHLVSESFLFCKTKVLRLYNGGISSGSEKLNFRCFLFSLRKLQKEKEKGKSRNHKSWRKARTLVQNFYVL